MTAHTSFDRFPSQRRRHAAARSKSPVARTCLRVAGITFVVCWLITLTFTSSWMVA